METRRYQSFFEETDNGKRWGQVPKTREHRCTSEDGSHAESNTLMETLNVSCASNTTASFKEDSIKKLDQSPVCLKQNQPFVYPVLNHNSNSIKMEMDSKELSKTVAESMGLYMNAARDVDYGFGQQNVQGGCHASPGKLFSNNRQQGEMYKNEENLSSSALSPKLKSLGSFITSPYPAVSRPSTAPSMECPVAIPASSSGMALSVCCSPQNSNSSMSSPTSNNLVSSTTSPSNIGNPCTSVSSPINHTSAAPTFANVHARNSAACSPTNTSNVGSPLASPLNVMRSPISSPHSMCSVKSPASCNANMRSSVSSPGSNNNNNSNMRASISSPAAVKNVTVDSPPYNSTGFPMSSPASGLGLVQNDIHSPDNRDQEFKGFEFPKVEKTEREIYSVGLDQMNMVKYIKSEPDTGFSSMCLLSEKPDLPSSPFATQIKTETDKDAACMNHHYNRQEHSLNLFPVSETSFLSLRDNIDEYSLSGILGPPVSSLNGNYELDAFPNNVLPKGIKQEPNDGSYYQENNNMPASAIVGVNSGGHSFHYQIGAQGTMSFSRHDVRDQSNPLLNLISPVTALMETWKSHPGLSQSSLSSRGEGYPGQRCIPENMSR
ncbi:MCR protein, partial [Amia calva]|nr:MCR protein [Amia calva]